MLPAFGHAVKEADATLRAAYLAKRNGTGRKVATAI
jgi:hypothetical protein